MPGSAQGPHGGGWKGVRDWCGFEVAQLGGLAEVEVLENADILIIHIDADVADEDEVQCAQPCPPVEDTIDELRVVLLGWLGEQSIPEDVVFCIPSKSTEAWVLAALFPDDAVVLPCDPPPQAAQGPCLECRDDPASILIGKRPKLVKNASGRAKKITKMYEQQGSRLTTAWVGVRAVCTQAERFSLDVVSALS
jgi:hypothetical protein